MRRLIAYIKKIQRRRELKKYLKRLQGALSANYGRPGAAHIAAEFCRTYEELGRLE